MEIGIAARSGVNPLPGGTLGRVLRASAAYGGGMDLAAVRAASRSELADCAVAAARNSQGLLDDAGLLAQAGRNGRAYALAVLATEECGKAMDLSALAILPDKVRAQAPLGRMLEWHQMKLVGGLLLTVLPLGGVASWLAAMPADEVARTIGSLAPADESDRVKRRGLYVDMEQDGIHEPSEVTEPEVDEQLGRARRATGSVASGLLGPQARAILANPPAEGVELVEELVAALTGAGDVRTPEAAVEVLVHAVEKYKASRHLQPPSVPTDQA